MFQTRPPSRVKLWALHHYHRIILVLRWGTAGLICLVVQLLLIWSLTKVWPVFWAAVAAYIVSGNLNFVINSLTTWRHRHPTMHGIVRRWLKFVMVNIVAGLMNGFILWCFHHLFMVINSLLGRSPDWYITAILAITPVILANAVSAVGNFWMYEKIVFKHEDPPTELVERNE